MLFLPAFLLFLMLAGCGQSVDAPASTLFGYTSYKDIPGVTEEEINAIEAFRGQNITFVYGIIPSTEAFLDENGEVGGFAALFCEYLTTLFGISFNPALNRWSDLIAGLESGKFDFTGVLAPIEERRAVFLMTDPIALHSVNMFRLAGSPPISYIASHRPLRYAFLDGTATLHSVKNTLQDAFEVHWVDSYEAAYELIKSEVIDGFIAGNTAEYAFKDYGDISNEFFYPLLYTGVSLATPKPSLEPFISVVQKMLKNGGDKFLGEMQKTGYKSYVKNSLLECLTKEEQAYLREKNSSAIPLLAEYDNYPTSFYNTRAKQWQGISFDVLNEITALTGLSFEVVNNQRTRWSELLNMLETGKGSMITELIRTQERIGRFLWPEASFQKDYYALLSKSDFKSVNFSEIMYTDVGYVHDIAYAHQFKKWFPDHGRTIEYGGTDLMLEALERGDIDLAMSCRNQLLYLTNFRELPNYKINFQFDHPFESTFGFYVGDSILCGIVNKTLRLIDTEYISAQWIRRVYDYRTKLSEERYPLILGICGLLVCVFALVLVLLFKNRNDGKRLELEVQARTTELKNSYAKLEKAVERAESANRVKSAFLAKMSHEIRTPMNAIMGMSELALRENIPAAAKEHIRTIKQASSSLLSIINDILDLSKIESGKVEIIPVNYCLASMIQDVASIIRTRLTESHVQFTVNIDSGIPSVLYGDEVRVRQVLLNILSNAVKYTKQGSITLAISGEITNADMAVLTMNVIDTGIGIKSEDVEKLFTDFVRVDTTANKGIEGTGLGLSIVKNLLTAMGGDIRVKSEYNVGSTFTVTLPQKIHSHEPMAQFDKPHDAAVIIFSAPNAKILVVDDIKTNLDVAKGLLAPYNMQVDTCQSGMKAIEALQKNMYDLILMDHMMPEMDGVETTKRIRKLDDGICSQVTIIALTANAVAGAKEMFLKNGFNDFLSKPINISKLGAMLERWVPKEKQADTVKTIFSVEQDINSDIYVEGIDVGVGLCRTGGTIEGYLRTLATFNNDGRGKLNDVKKALENNDFKLYTTHVHALKSAAANVGAVEISEIAKSLEDAGNRQDISFINENTPRLLANLEKILDNVDGVISAEREKSSSYNIDKKKLHTVLTNLKTAIDDMDVSAINAAVKELEPFENAMGIGIRIVEIVQYAQNGVFDEAIELIDELLKKQFDFIIP